MSGYLYAIEIERIGVRIGVSADGEERVRQHRSALASYGMFEAVGNHYVSAPHPHAKTAEVELHIQFASRRIIGTKEVYRIKFSEAVEAIDGMASWSPSIEHPLMTARQFGTIYGFGSESVRRAIREAGIATIEAGAITVICPSEIDRLVGAVKTIAAKRGKYAQKQNPASERLT